jgi:hypothetical protein
MTGHDVETYLTNGPSRAVFFCLCFENAAEFLEIQLHFRCALESNLRGATLKKTKVHG